MALAWALTGSSAHGQAAFSSPEARGTQFVFVIDDSRSMREKLPGEKHPAADPNRLSIFAVRALLSMLDPTDEATVVRLNGPLEGEAPPAIEPLAENRGRLDGLLAGGPLADYAGDYTPCRSALEATRRLLDAAHRDGVAQVVFFLTDGECTPRRDQAPKVDAFLSGLRSHADDRFRFYLLRFEGRPYTRSLVDLAQATGGDDIKVSGDEPTGVLAPFADALTHSQGYEAALLTPSAPLVAAHRGARRMRLLAVAPGESPGLSFRIVDRQGKSPSVLNQPPPGVHQHGGGRPYRWVALDYLPTLSPMNVDVEGAGERWKAVAVPEYRLAVTMEIFRGACDSPQAPIDHGTEAGHPVCAVLRLVNDRGQTVERSGVGGLLEAGVDYSSCNEEVRDLPAEPRGDLAEFVFARQRLEACDHVFSPHMMLTLPGGGEPLRLRGRRRSIEASALDMVAQPSSLDLGALRPASESKPARFSLDGNFPQGPGHLEVANRQALPSCLTFTLNGEAEGAPVILAPGGHYTLVARLAGYCGLQSFERRFDPRLRVVLDAEGLGAAAEIGTSLDVDYRFDLPRPATVQLDAGGSSEVTLALGGNQEHGFEMEAVLAGRGEHAAWSDDLALGFAAGRDELETSGGELLATKLVKIDPAAGTATLELRVRADRCCAGGAYETFVGLVPGVAVYGGEPPAPISVPLRVEVTPAGFWACRGGLVLWALAILLLVVLVVYVILMVQHSSFIDRGHLAELLVPLTWTGFGDVQPESRLAGEVRAMVDHELPLGRRVAAWLGANPLRIGLPGGRYYETVELLLQPEPAVDRSRLVVVREPGIYARLSEEPAPDAGRLFARAVGGGIEFFAVLKRGRIGRLAPARLALNSWGGDGDGEEKPRLLTLKRKEKLIHPIPETDRQKGRAAGWRVG